MGTSVITKPSSGEIYPGIDVISFGAPVEKIRETAKKLSKGTKAYMPNITEVGKTILTKKEGAIVRFNAATKKIFKSEGKKSIVTSASVKKLLDKLLARKYADTRGER